MSLRRASLMVVKGGAQGWLSSRLVSILLSLIFIAIVICASEMLVQARVRHAMSDVEYMGAADAELARILVAENSQGDLGASLLSQNQAGTTYFAKAAVDTFVTVGGVLARKCPEAVSAGTQPQARAASTLVLYVYNAVDDEQGGNFDFFLRFGLSPNDTVTYRIVITSGGPVKPPLALPQLPPNAQYITTPACIGTWGALGAIEEQMDASKYPYVVVIDSSVRGPFLPPYAAGAMHWTEAFTSRLTESVKMVGSAISCEGAPRAGHAALEWRRNPYVLPYAWATDAVRALWFHRGSRAAPAGLEGCRPPDGALGHRLRDGKPCRRAGPAGGSPKLPAVRPVSPLHLPRAQDGWAVLTADPNIFRCFENAWDARYYSDVGAGLAMLRAGYNLDSLLMRYQGVDWWGLNTWDCNGR